MIELLLAIPAGLAVAAGAIYVNNRQSMSLRGRALKKAAGLVSKLPKSTEDAEVVARAQARMAADDAAMAAFKDAVSKL
jgi:hypothetical protein